MGLALDMERTQMNRLKNEVPTGFGAACTDCWKPFPVGETAYLVIACEVDEDGGLVEEEDVGVFHGDCWIEASKLRRQSEEVKASS